MLFALQADRRVSPVEVRQRTRAHSSHTSERAAESGEIGVFSGLSQSSEPGQVSPQAWLPGPRVPVGVRQVQGVTCN